MAVRVIGQEIQVPARAIYAEVVDGIRILRGEVKSGGLVIVTPEEEAIESSSAFKADYAEAVATNATLSLIFTTDTSTKYSNIEAEIRVQQAQVAIKLYEGVARSEATTVTVYNRDRTSAITSATTVAHTPTAVTVTTTILVDSSISTTQPFKILRFKLNISKIYYLLLTPVGAGTNNMSVRLRWFDHSDLVVES